MTSVSFLTTRISCPTKEDEKKLIRVLEYLHGTKDLCLTIEDTDGMAFISFIGASFAIHMLTIFKPLFKIKTT